jgi:hypothetical protein
MGGLWGSYVGEGCERVRDLIRDGQCDVAALGRAPGRGASVASWYVFRVRVSGGREHEERGVYLKKRMDPLLATCCQWVSC